MPAERSYGASLEVTRKIAKEKDLELIFPKPSELFIDIDAEEDLRLVDRGMAALTRMYADARIIRHSPSPSGRKGHYHVVIDVGEPLKEKDRLILQAVCGTDPKASLCGLAQLNRGEKQVSRFFEKKGQ